jgi:hypothetical protein
MVFDPMLRDQCLARDWSRQLLTTSDASGATAESKPVVGGSVRVLCLA